MRRPAAGYGARRPSWRPVHASATVLYVCIPSYNEAVTVGVLLWRLRTTLREQAGGRDYEVVVYDDASTDATADVLAPYARVLPLTVLRGDVHAGQATAVDALIRHVVARSHAPDTDALLVLQADYTDAPELVGEMLPLFDAGADVVLTRRAAAPDQPLGERRVRRAAPVLLAPLVRSAVSDGLARDPIALLSTMRIFRVSVLRDALAARGTAPLVRAPGWAGTAELLVRTAPFARRVERVEAPARYDVRARPSRIEWTRELRAIAALLWQTRSLARAAGRPTAPTPDPVLPQSAPPQSAAPQSAARRREPPRERPSNPRESTRAEDAREAEDVPEAGGTTEVSGTTATDVGASDAAPRAARRRRRSRGRQGTTEASAIPTDVMPTDVMRAPDAPTDAAPDAPATGIRANAGENAPENTLPEPTALDLTPPVVDGSDATPAKRRRRRGGARRRARGPESDMGVSPDLGVSPEIPDASATPWQGAPTDQPSS